MPDISITYGMHEGHPFTYRVYMTDGKRSTSMIYDFNEFQKEMQYFIKDRLRKFRK